MTQLKTGWVTSSTERVHMLVCTTSGKQFFNPTLVYLGLFGSGKCFYYPTKVPNSCVCHVIVMLVGGRNVGK
jgi:hypothetical protein